MWTSSGAKPAFRITMLVYLLFSAFYSINTSMLVLLNRIKRVFRMDSTLDSHIGINHAFLVVHPGSFLDVKADAAKVR